MFEHPLDGLDYFIIESIIFSIMFLFIIKTINKIRKIPINIEDSILAHIFILIIGIILYFIFGFLGFTEP